MRSGHPVGATVGEEPAVLRSRRKLGQTLRSIGRAADAFLRLTAGERAARRAARRSHVDLGAKTAHRSENEPHR